MARRTLATAALLCAAVLTGCSDLPETFRGPGATPPTPATAAPGSVETPGDGELTPGFDQKPDSPVTADRDLSQRQISALLRLQATDGGAAGRCRPGDVAVSVGNLDAAAGHRFGRIIVTNTSSRSCTLRGFPGIGARGEWGHTFALAVEQRQPRFDGVSPTPRTVTVQPRGAAFADLEWTGELAGAESEKASSLALQLTRGGSAFLVPATGTVASDGGNTGVNQPVALDIGMQTTVRVGPFRTE